MHGRWPQAVAAGGAGFQVGSQSVGYSQQKDPTAVPWAGAGVDLVLECSGKFKTPETLEPYFTVPGLKRVIVACPVKGVIAGEEALNVVFGINHHLYDPLRHRLLTAASCTTNCLAPVVKVVHESFGIRHGSITTLHDVTNTQVVVDAFKSDLRRARSCLQIVDPHHHRLGPGDRADLPRAAGQAQRPRRAGAAAQCLAHRCGVRAEARGERRGGERRLRGRRRRPAAGNPGLRNRPLVSVDYVNDSRSAIVDALSTLVVNGTQLKVYAWYDNEWGYSCRMADLACHVAALERAALVSAAR